MTEHCAKVGDLVRDTDRSRVGILTDVRDGTPILRPRYGGTVFDDTWCRERQLLGREPADAPEITPTHSVNVTAPPHGVMGCQQQVFR